MKKHLGLLLLLTFILSPSAWAKEMTSRLGVGYSNSFSLASLPSVAVKYYSSKDISFSAALGIDTNNNTSASTGTSSFGFGGKFYKTIFTEDNLNFYMGGGASLVSSSATVAGTSSSASGFELSGFCGAEWFFPGLDSVGINFQAGVGITSVSSGVRFRTIGDTPLSAGMYFYF